MASNDMTGQIAELLKKSPDGIATIQRVLNTFSSANTSQPDPGGLFLTSEDQFMTLMMGSLEYAIFPRAMRPAFSSFAGITTRESAWHWVVRQVRTNVVDESWVHASNLGKLDHAFSKMFFAMGRCKLPIYLARDRADAWSDM